MKNVLLLSVVIAICIFGCKKKESTPDAPATTTSGTTTGGTTTGGGSTIIDVNSTPQTTFAINGSPVTYIADEVVNTSGSGVGSSGGDNFNYSSGISNMSGTIEYIGFTKGTLNTAGTGNPTDAVFKAFFALGSKPYSLNYVSGIEASMTDAAGVTWTTSKGTGNQTGSTFTIDQILDSPDLSGIYYAKVKISFSCKLYDGSGNVKTITNGVYVGYFGNI